MRNVFTIALCLAALPGFSQLKFETYYGNMAGWGSTTDIGVSYNDKGFYVTSKLAYIQSFGLGEDADNFGLVLGAGKDWFIAEHWYAGGQLDLRWADTNASRRRDWASGSVLILGIFLGNCLLPGSARPSLFHRCPSQISL